MWSTFINDTEGMSDFVLFNGQIVYQITCKYSDNQIGSVADEWKFISPNNLPPKDVVDWVNKHMGHYTGALNVQYRGNHIIEVGLRFGRGGAYIYCSKNNDLIRNINNLVEHNIWDYSKSYSYDFKPYYSFKAYTSAPLVYTIPHHYYDHLIKKFGAMEFYEHYFEPSGRDGMVFFQFMHTDFHTGMKLKQRIEFEMYMLQYFFVFCFISTFIFYIARKAGLLCFDMNYLIIITCIIVLLFSTRYLNPIGIHYNLYLVQKQMIL
jgi:hypothetical protein